MPHKKEFVERMVSKISKQTRALIIDSPVPLKIWGEVVCTAVYLHRLALNEGLHKREEQDANKATHYTLYEMLHSRGKPAIAVNGNRILYKAPLYYLP